MNLYIENLGTTFINLLDMANIVDFNNFTLNFDNITNYINLLHIWPTQAEFNEGVLNVLFIVYSSDNYFEALKTTYSTMPQLFALDYLHLFYAKQLVYAASLNGDIDTYATITKPLTLHIQLDTLYSHFSNKWGYTISLFAVVFFFSNILQVRYQYGFNFYFNYFKALSDLGEQEYGSYDDYKFFLFLLVQMLVWYCWVIFIGYTFSLQSESKLVLLTVSVMITILLIPIRLLWDFGLAFGMYVRGAASSSNLVVEAFFDIIGVIIIFTRFIVQNIRFLLVFVAFFELFEWAGISMDAHYALNFTIGTLPSADLLTAIESKNLFTYIIISIKIGFIYLYHLLHLIIVSFMQIGVYLMVSFWLFFFLYTSFFKITSDNYFFIKRTN